MSQESGTYLQHQVGRDRQISGDQPGLKQIPGQPGLYMRSFLNKITAIPKLWPIPEQNTIQMLLRRTKYRDGWIDRSVPPSTYWSFGGQQFSSQHFRWVTQVPVTPALGIQHPLPVSMGTALTCVHAQTDRQQTPFWRIKSKIFENNFRSFSSNIKRKDLYVFIQNNFKVL